MEVVVTVRLGLVPWAGVDAGGGSCNCSRVVATRENNTMRLAFKSQIANCELRIANCEHRQLLIDIVNQSRREIVLAKLFL